jgi:hypothetical protein
MYWEKAALYKALRQDREDEIRKQKANGNPNAHNSSSCVPKFKTLPDVYDFVVKHKSIPKRSHMLFLKYVTKGMICSAVQDDLGAHVKDKAEISKLDPILPKGSIGRGQTIDFRFCGDKMGSSIDSAAWIDIRSQQLADALDIV